MNNRPVQWKEVKFNRKECDADRCKVYVDVELSRCQCRALAGKVDRVNQHAKRNLGSLDDGEWYFLPK